MNILVLSCGTRNKIIRYFKQALDGVGKVVATDMSPYAPALYEVDTHYIVPRITAPDYIDQVLAICVKEKINGVLSLIDPELSLLARNADRFASVGTTVIGSDAECCDRAMNKMQMYRWLTAHGYPCAKSFDDLQSFYTAQQADEVTYPVFVKPICGSASIAISKAQDPASVEFLFRSQEDMMVQEYLHGNEIGADVYIDLISGEVVSIFTKKKLVMRAGETDKAVSFKDEKLFALIEKFAKESGFRGQIDIDLFEVDGNYYISEVNPRFGGGYPHAYACGVDNMKLILNNLQGKINLPQIGSYEPDIFMFKYNDIMTRRL